MKDEPTSKSSESERKEREEDEQNDNKRTNIKNACMQRTYSMSIFLLPSVENAGCANGLTLVQSETTSRPTTKSNCSINPNGSLSSCSGPAAASSNREVHVAACKGVEIWEGIAKPGGRPDHMALR